MTTPGKTEAPVAGHRGLTALERPPAQHYDLVALDLDGVVYVGSEAVPHAASALEGARGLGTRTAFVTNNAARTPTTVAEHLTSLGVQAGPEDVVNSAQAAARLLAADHAAGSRIFVIGGEGLLVALRDRGLEPVTAVTDDPVAVVSGYAPDLPWERVRDGAILVRRGLPWVATNTDASVPTPHGRGPGNGVLVGVVADFAEREPVVAGKPERALLDETVERTGAQRPVFVGDRVETDIDGAHRAGMAGLLVLTGVSDLASLLRIEADSRPDLVGVDLRCLLEPHPPVEVAESLDVAVCGGVEVRHDDGWRVPDPDGDDGGLLPALRAVTALAWARLDADHDIADVDDLAVRWGLPG
ncbi:HAD-IIA family hydrolase [Nocardioidaceae bacterium]|nr:HAD-IIA family hydrolase [Nocardioidaceae bacterium]